MAEQSIWDKAKEGLTAGWENAFELNMTKRALADTNEARRKRGEKPLPDPYASPSPNPYKNLKK